MFMSGASILGSNIIYIVIINIIMFLLFLIRRRNIDVFFIGIFFSWAIINYISLLLNNGNLTIYGFIGSTMYFLFPYLVLKIVGPSFWDRFEDILYKMAVITLPIFALSIITPSIFDSLHGSFSYMTNNIFNELVAGQENYWYSYFFTYSGRGDYRNSGFMWEPGAFAMILIILIIYTWCRDGIKIGLRQIVYFVCIITTFSTAGYLAMCILVIIFLSKLKNPITKFALSIIVIAFFISIYNAPFMA